MRTLVLCACLSGKRMCVCTPYKKQPTKIHKKKEQASNDVQQVFNALQTRLPIVRGPTRFIPQSTLGKIMQAYIILHNMAIEDKKDLTSTSFVSNEASVMSAVLPSSSNNELADCFTRLIHRNATTISGQPTHNQLRDIIAHIWQKFEPFEGE
jgi:hypothetical protein